MEDNKFNIIVFSGDMDKVLASFILATTAASMGMEVRMFFTFWGLNVLRKKGRRSGKTLLQKLMNMVNRGGSDKLPLSKLNMLGLGPLMMKRMMKNSKLPDIDGFMKIGRELGVKFIACLTSLEIMGLAKEDLIEEVDSFVGAASFLGDARDGKMTFFV